MKPTLDIQLIGLSETIRSNIKDVVIDLIEQRDIWTKMWALDEYQDEEARWILFIRVPFFEKSKRNSFRGKIRSEVMKTWHVCEVGSYIALHNCDHDRETRRGCKLEKTLEKTLEE